MHYQEEAIEKVEELIDDDRTPEGVGYYGQAFIDGGVLC